MQRLKNTQARLRLKALGISVTTFRMPQTCLFTWYYPPAAPKAQKDWLVHQLFANQTDKMYYKRQWNKVKP